MTSSNQHVISDHAPPSFLSFFSLSNLYQHSAGDGWTNNDNWLSITTPKYDWHGVRCNTEGQITELHLGSNNLMGSINLREILPGLPYLEYLDLSNNSLTGTIQDDFSDGLEQLKHLDISSNAFDVNLEVNWPDFVVFGNDYEDQLAQSEPPSQTPSHDSCQDHKCKNGSECIPDENAEQLGYTCNCNSKKPSKKSEYEMYYGEFCEIKACVNNGICVAPYTDGTGFEDDLLAGLGEYLPRPISQPSASSYPSLSPTADVAPCTPRTFRQHNVPQFILSLGSNTNRNFANEIPSGEVEGILSVFLTNTFATLMGQRDVSFITTLKATEISTSELASINSEKAERHERRLASKGKGTTVIRTIDSYAMIQDCAFESSAGISSKEFDSANMFLASAMSEAYQNRTTLLNLFKSSKVPALQSVDFVDIADRMEVCPNDLICQYGSTCAEESHRAYTCDCSTASDPAGIFTVFDGPQCEFAATMFCSSEPSVMEYSYCVNDGVCKNRNVGLGEPHPGCMCGDEFEESKCEVKKQPRKPVNASAIILGVGGALAVYALFYKPRDERKYCTFSLNPISYLRPCFRLFKRKKSVDGDVASESNAGESEKNSTAKRVLDAQTDEITFAGDTRPVAPGQGSTIDSSSISREWN